MFVNSIELQQFRNYEHLKLDSFGPVNLLIGQNAQGKTNLAEAIFALALTKSHRTSRDKELIRFGEERARLTAEVDKKYGSVKLELALSQQGKKAKINGLEQRKLSDFVGTLNVVMFAPEDLEIVKGTPGVRRRFLDMEIGQVAPGYLYHLQQYQKVLVQRNNLLKQLWGQNASAQTMLEVWNEQLVEHGVKIVKKRKQFIKKLQKWAETIHQGITGGGEVLRLAYLPSFSEASEEDEAVLMDQFMIKLSQMKEQEIRRGTTLSGPHRDDLSFFINDREVQTYGSQGQQRTTALSLKLAEIELIHEEIGEYPVLLLDDVLSELDPFRQTQLIETFQSKVQTFITATGIESLNLDKLKDASIYHVHAGQVER
ncbi:MULTISPECIES: DNA replication/repair protein RecF [Paenibacillus]|uniref:DNA replication and repair protein RecF n=2 Tax=Paenibacillus TaxID=44249 RepID=A0AAP5LS73_PAEAM|nr:MULTISPECIES: DNA replication/repair protein RecF [Paenibacillus]KQY85952.1 recombinase RecF [Paenibacillus sp. Root52]MCG7378023.1 DNA replication/repair protein RecF [Paenibacillus sp. ACRSA]MDQ0172627.1 DNA replication and repair protein RecF [Paenibacillus tundrae]MDR6727158.1 DNA replication and repair protein RecF [Paenibacillus amylolyticus]